MEQKRRRYNLGAVLTQNRYPIRGGSVLSRYSIACMMVYLLLMVFHVYLLIQLLRGNTGKFPLPESIQRSRANSTLLIDPPRGSLPLLDSMEKKVPESKR